MRREIKELYKKVDEIAMAYDADDTLGCGFLPREAHDYYNGLYIEVTNRIANLRGFETYEDYCYHESICFDKAMGFIFN